MSNNSIQPLHSALLIGVGLNVQRSGTCIEDQSLMGAVQDVRDIKDYLKTSPLPVDVTLLTASKAVAGDKDGRAIEPEERQANYQNVISHLTRIIAIGKSQPGHRVYIHFSGHGTQNPEDGSLHLVLFHLDQFGSRHLPGSFLRNALKQMGMNGMFVTLVLDCCFSGRVLRHSTAAIRFVRYDSSIAALTDFDDPFEVGASNELRAATAKPKGILQPSGYSVFAACGPDEEAWEIDNDGVRNGALSYFLRESLAVLSGSNGLSTHELLHQYILAEFRSHHAIQTPMLFGNRRTSFFDNLRKRSGQPMNSIYRRKIDGQLVLDAGRVHSVHLHDEYLAYPMRYLSGSVEDKAKVAVRMKVVLVDDLTSEVTKIVSTQHVHLDGSQDAVESPWTANLVSSLSPQKIRVSLMSNIPRREELKDLAGTSPACQYLQLSLSEQAPKTPIYQVVQCNGNVYKVQHISGKGLTNFPHVYEELESSESRTTFLANLGHLATFKYIEGIMNQNPDPEFTESVSITCDRNLGADGFYETDHDTWMNLTFANLGKKTIYVTALRLGSFWQVENMTLSVTNELFVPVLPKAGHDDGKETWDLYMQVPADEPLDSDEEVFKIFVTTKATMFPAFILPCIGEDVVRDGAPEFGAKLQELVSDTSETREDRDNWFCSNLYVRTHRRQAHVA